MAVKARQVGRPPGSDLGDKQRIALLDQDHYIPYPGARKLEEELEALLAAPRRIRMSSLVIVGPPGNGKSTTLDHFLLRHPSYRNPTASGLIYPVLRVQARSGMTISGFCEAILDLLEAPHRQVQSADRWLNQTVTVLRAVDLRVLMIDEVHDVLSGGTRAHIQFVNTLKFLSNELRISLVAAGLPEAERALSVDKQLASRFEYRSLPRWTNGKDYWDLLETLEARLPLRKESFLSAEPLSELILGMSEGTIGGTVKLLRKAAETAIREKQEQITIDLLRSLDWTPLSRSRRD